MDKAKNLGDFIKEKRGFLKITQRELADSAGVGLRFVRELEANKQTVRLDKVGQVLKVFGCKLWPIPISGSRQREIEL
jgi:y4mF family transcriptional regulator